MKELKKKKSRTNRLIFIIILFITAAGFYFYKNNKTIIHFQNAISDKSIDIKLDLTESNSFAYSLNQTFHSGFYSIKIIAESIVAQNELSKNKEFIKAFTTIEGKDAGILTWENCELNKELNGCKSVLIGNVFLEGLKNIYIDLNLEEINFDFEVKDNFQFFIVLNKNL